VNYLEKEIRVPKGWEGGGGLWSPGTLTFLSWSPEPKDSLYLEPEQKCCFRLNGALE